jgi:hypothetical protein
VLCRRKNPPPSLPLLPPLLVPLLPPLLPALRLLLRRVPMCEVFFSLHFTELCGYFFLSLFALCTKQNRCMQRFCTLCMIFAHADQAAIGTRRAFKFEDIKPRPNNGTLLVKKVLAIMYA